MRPYGPRAPGGMNQRMIQGTLCRGLEGFVANVGICLLMTQHDFDLVGLARKVEELGFGSLWAPEHGVVPADFSVGAAGG